jgi:minor extracellular serine protease Vpr
MKRIFLLIASAVSIAAQPIPGRYIVELQTPPAASVSAAKRARYSAADLDVAAHRARLQAEHAVVEADIRSLGGAVTNHYDTLINAMAANLTGQAAAQLRQMPNVKGVYPVNRHHKLLDHAVNVHHVPQAWQTLPGGMSGAGAGIKIGILDTGIDIAHPGFQGFTTAVPTGFPLVSASTETANTNNKVIVSRVYSDPVGGISNTTGADLDGHGTGVAMIAAGLTNTPGLSGVAPITGAAPGAWLGNYKVLDDNGFSTDATFLNGLEDAVNDGMNVVNYSSGSIVLDTTDENGGPVSRAIASAVAAGTLVVVAAGNAGPDLETIGSPAVTPAAIAVGASENERFFWNAVTVGGLPYFAIEPDAYVQAGYSGQISGAIIDVTALDTNGYGCSAFAANSLTGQIALISRGGTPTPCTFDAKINNAQAAGAVGVVIYDNRSETIFDYTVDQPLFGPALSTATLPTLFVSQADGQNIQQQVQASSGIAGKLDFDGFTALPHPSNVVSWFSSGGPSPSGRIRPDVLAVGDWYLTADTTQSHGQGSSLPYTLGAGTSFSAPMVTGALAVVMSARPGLPPAAYRSLVVNSAPELDQYPSGSVVTPQTGGAGRLDLLGALQSNLTVSPSSVDFLAPATAAGSSTSAVEMAANDSQAAPAASAGNSSEIVTVSNVGSASDTFTVTVNSLDNVAIPVIDVPTFSLAPGASQQVTVSIPGSGSLAPGQYHGFINIAGTKSPTAARVPYWYGVPGTSVQFITALSVPASDPPGSSDSIIFRSTDLIGLPFEPASYPAVTTSSPQAMVVDVTPSGSLPGTFRADIQIGRADQGGLNVFTITFGNVSRDIPIQVQ